MATRASQEQLHNDVEQRLKMTNQRYPQSRKAVVSVLDAEAHPLTVAELEEKLGSKVPVSTIYRNLAILEEAKVINRLTSADGNGRFELAEEVSGDHHHHLVCMKCGKVFDFEVTPSLEESLLSSTKSVTKLHGFNVVWHQIDLHGYCVECA